MKKAALTTAILAAMVSGSSLAATVYSSEGTEMKIGGRVEVRGMFNGDGDGNEIEGTMEDSSRARINFKGKTEISDGVTGFAAMEYEIKDGEETKNRTLYTGLKSGGNAFSYGRQDTANVQISDMTDIASEHSGQQQYLKSASDKESNTFLYTGEFGGVTAQASYQASGEEDKDAFGISALWNSDFGLDLGASYTAAGDEGSEGGDSGEATQYTLGAGYTMNDLYLGFTYAAGDKSEATEFTSMELAAQYKLTKEFRLIGIYGKAEEETGSTTVDTEDFFAIEGQYRFNKSIRTYASYKINSLDDAEDSLMLGLRYNF